MNIQGEKKIIKVEFLSATFGTSNPHILSLLQMPAKGFSSWLVQLGLLCVRLMARPGCKQKERKHMACDLQKGLCCLEIQEAWGMGYTRSGLRGYLGCPQNVPATCILIRNRLKFLPLNSCKAILDKGCFPPENSLKQVGKQEVIKSSPNSPLPLPTRQQRDWVHLLGPVWFALLPSTPPPNY